MALLHFNSRKHLYDFTKKRVREQIGSSKPKVMTKFDVCYLIERLDFYKGLYADILSYEDCKALLLELLEKRNFDNVTIIK